VAAPLRELLAEERGILNPKSLHPVSYTINLTPEILNPKPWIPHPSILDRKPYTQNTESLTLNSTLQPRCWTTWSTYKAAWRTRRIWVKTLDPKP